MSCRSGHSGRSGIQHIAVTVRAAGRQSHLGRTTAMWRSLKGSGYLGTVEDSAGTVLV